MNTKRQVILTAIVNSCNRLDLLRTALPSLLSALAHCSLDTAIVVYDADSMDGSADWVIQFARDQTQVRIDLIRPGGADSSFSSGINSASDYAAKTFPETKWYLLFETDNWVSGAEPLHQALRLLESHQDIAAAGFTVRKHSGEPTGYGCSFPTITQFVLGQQITHWLRLDAPDDPDWQQFGNSRWSICDVVYTSPLLVRRSAWEAGGGLDAETFPYSDSDVDWAYRLHHLKWKMAVIGSDEVVHDNNQVLSHWSTTRVLHFHRARMRLLRRHRSAWVRLLWPVLVLRHSFELAALWVIRLSDPKRGDALQKRWTLLKSAFRCYEPA